MPLLTIKDAGTTGKLGLWHITESLAELLNIRSFPAEELKTLDGLSYEHRKKEWLATRILTEKLTRNPDAHIVYDAYNKPFLKDSATHISLSHSHDLLVVILDQEVTGVDVELIKPKIERIKHKFMSDQELDSLQKENIQDQLTTYWCAKESLYKLYGKKELSFRENLVIEPFRYSEKGAIRGWVKNAAMNKCFTLNYEKVNCGDEHYLLAYVIYGD